MLIILYPITKNFYLYLTINHIHPNNTKYNYRVPNQKPKNEHNSHKSKKTTH